MPFGRLGNMGLGFSPRAIIGSGGGDTTAPTLTSPTDAANGSTGATISVSTNEANGTLYWYISTSATPPSAANLKAGTGAVVSGNQAVSATGTQNASPTGLTASTAYYTYFLHRDGAGNDSSTATADGFTTTAEAGAAPEIWAFTGDSLMDYPGSRDAEDTNWTDVYQVLAGGTISSDTTPMEGCEGLSPAEYFMKTNVANGFGKQFGIMCAMAGSGVLADDVHNWSIGGTWHEAAKTRINEAIAAVKGAYPTAVFKGFYECVGTNDVTYGEDPDEWYAARKAALEDFGDHIYENGVSGATIGDDFLFFQSGMMPEMRSTDPACANNIERYKQQLSKEYSSPMQFFSWEDLGHYNPPSDILHQNVEGSRIMGTTAADYRIETTPPVLSITPASVGGGTNFVQGINTPDHAWPYIVGGADAALFEIIAVDYLTTTGTPAVNSWTYQLRKLGGGSFDYADPEDAGGNNVYDVQIACWGFNGVASNTVNHTVTVTPPYGVGDQGPITIERLGFYTGAGWGDDGITFTADIEPGLNLFYLATGGGGNISNAIQLYIDGAPSTAGAGGNGIIAADTGGPNSQGVYGYISPVAIPGAEIHFGYSGGSHVNGMFQHSVMNGTKATPLSADWFGWNQESNPQDTGAETCPTNGMIVSHAITDSGQSYTSVGTGCTAVYLGRDAIATRTTSGTVELNATFPWHGMATLVWEKSV